MHLKLNANISRPDDFYNKLIDRQRDMSPEDIERMNCKLILILANQVGDFELLSEAIDLASD